MSDTKSPYRHFIEGNVIYLREVSVSDVNESYYRWLNDPAVTRYLETRYIPRSLDNIRDYVAAMDGKTDEIFLAICLKETDQHIGNIKLGPINWVHRFGDISLLIGEKDYWGRGIASEAIGILSQFAFDVLNLNKLRSGCYSDNVGSAQAFKKAGFSHEGTLKKQWLVKGAFQDEFLFGLHRSDGRNYA